MINLTQSQLNQNKIILILILNQVCSHKDKLMKKDLLLNHKKRHMNITKEREKILIYMEEKEKRKLKYLH
jgi:hypothetical protein